MPPCRQRKGSVASHTLLGPWGKTLGNRGTFFCLGEYTSGPNMYPALDRQGLTTVLFAIFVSGPRIVNGERTVERVIHAIRVYPDAAWLIYKSRATSKLEPVRIKKTLLMLIASSILDCSITTVEDTSIQRDAKTVPVLSLAVVDGENMKATCVKIARKRDDTRQCLSQYVGVATARSEVITVTKKQCLRRRPAHKLDEIIW